MPAVKTQISSRYNKGVTNCLSTRHISISLQKIVPKFARPNSICVKSYKQDDLAHKAVFLISASLTGIWR